MVGGGWEPAGGWGVSLREFLVGAPHHSLDMGFWFVYLFFPRSLFFLLVLTSTVKTPPIISNYQVPKQSVIFDTTDEPMLISHYHSKAIVYMIAPYWLCTFYGFGEMYNDDVYPPWWYHTEYFDSPKNPVPCLLILPCPNPWSLSSFWCVYSFTFSRMACQWNYTLCSLPRSVSLSW